MAATRQRHVAETAQHLPDLGVQQIGDIHLHPGWVIATQGKGGRTGQTRMKGSCCFGMLLSPGKEGQALELVTPEFNLPPKSQQFF